MKNRIQKKLFIFIFLFVALFAIPTCVLAKEEQTAQTTINGVTVNWTYEVNESNQIINLKCTNPADLTGNLSIPSTIDGKTVVSLDDGAFRNATQLTSLYIPKSLIEDGGWTGVGPFTGCKNITSVTFENGITRIPENICVDLTGITEITIPDSVKEIGDSAFSGCTKLINVDLGNITIIDEGVFKNCTSLKSITIPKTLKETYSSLNAYKKLFEGCTNLTEIKFEEGITVIPDWICKGTNIESITIPNSVEKIGDEAFQNCTKLTNVTIPSSVKEIGDSAFRGCTNLTNIDLGNITKIEHLAFKDCTSLKSITIPKTLKETYSSLNVSNIVFEGCTNLTEIKFEDGITVIPAWLCRGTNIENIMIPDSVEKIENQAFRECTKLTNVTIPSSVKEIGYEAFYECTKLANVDLSNVMHMETAVFENCTSLKSIIIPKTLKKVSYSVMVDETVFKGCTNLTEIKFEDGITVIPKWLCRDTNIKEATIPNSVTEIEKFAFADSTSLEKITILDNVTKIASSAFDNHNENLTIYCYKDSYVDEYVKEHNSKNDCPIKVVYLQRPDNEEPANPEQPNEPEQKPSAKDDDGEKKDNQNKPEKLPQTGFGIGLVLVIAGATVLCIYNRKKYNNLKNIK